VNSADFAFLNKRMIEKFEGGTFELLGIGKGIGKANHKESELKAAMVKIVGKYANMARSKQILHCWQIFVKVFKKENYVAANSEQTEVEDVDYYQIVSPVEEVEDEEDGREEVHGNPVDPLICHLNLFSNTPGVSLMICPLPIYIMLILS